jgi:hypothetical protein
MLHRNAPRAPLIIALAVLPLAAAAGPPPEDRCPTLGAAPGAEAFEDAVPVPLREGMVLSAADLLQLRTLLPEEIWRLRDVFFHEGMQLEIGPCHRRYPVSDFQAAATARFAGRAKLDPKGNLRDYVAGLPFPPETIDPKAADAGARWAWNLEERYRGAGPAGSFRIVDMPSRTAGTFTFRGTFFFLRTRHRADLEETGYAMEEAGDAVWVAGGRFDEPFNTRHLAWTQSRPVAALWDFREPDDTFVYVPNMRKVRRASTTWVDGIYTPRYRVGGDEGGGGIAVGGDGYSGSQGAIQPTAARSIQVTEDGRAGFTGLSLRPNAYVWKLMEEREVLAPLNGTRAAYPVAPDRNFGPSGLSLGSDRWDVRYAAVIAGQPRERGGPFERIEIWVDWQTQQPLYVFTRQSRSRLAEVIVHVHRFSGDVSGYPAWPDGSAANVFDPVVQVSYAPIEGGTGWRRESYDVVSVPPDPELLRRYTSTDFLLRGR